MNNYKLRFNAAHCQDGTPPWRVLINDEQELLVNQIIVDGVRLTTTSSMTPLGEKWTIECESDNITYAEDSKVFIIKTPAGRSLHETPPSGKIGPFKTLLVGFTKAGEHEAMYKDFRTDNCLSYRDFGGAVDVMKLFGWDIVKVVIDARDEEEYVKRLTEIIVQLPMPSRVNFVNYNLVVNGQTQTVTRWNNIQSIGGYTKFKLDERVLRNCGFHSHEQFVYSVNVKQRGYY